MGKHISKQLSIGGMYSAGDGGNNPDGTVRLLQNYLPRPNRMPSRPPLAYDSLMNISGLADFDDVTNNVTRLVAVDASHHVFTKSATVGAETWGSANATSVTGDRLSSAVTYRGKMYMLFDDATTGLPKSAAVYDGTTLSTSPFNSAIAARSAAIYKERLHLSYPRLTFRAWFNGSLLGAAAYDFAGGVGWALTSITAANVVANGGTVSRLYLTSTTASSFRYSAGFAPSVGPISVAASDTPSAATWRFAARNLSATFRMPITLTMRIATLWGVGTFNAGDIISDGTNIQRCIVGGATGGSAPGWSTTLGGTTVDSAITWQCEGNDTIAFYEGFLPIGSDTDQPTVVNLTGWVPPATNGVTVGVKCLFANTTTPTITLGSVDMSFKDGLSDGDPSKANWGQQFTTGDYEYPFFNQESSLTATVDLQEEIWSEVGLPASIQASNTYKLIEVPGFPTAASVAGNRKITFKRTAFWQFQAGTSADIPIRLERLFVGIGCVGPLAEDVFEDVIYFIGENDIYAYSIGDSAPSPICGDGMREEIMNKDSSSWVESQATCNRPILKIDQNQLIAWVYTQKGRLYAYDLRAKLWSRHVIGDGFGIDAMAWNRNTGNFYIAFDSASHGLARMVYSSRAPDTIDNTGTTYPGEKVIVFRPIELTDPMRYDAYCEGVQILYASAGGQEVTLEISDNQGATYANSVDYTPVAVSTSGDFVPMTLDVCESGPSCTLKLTATGDLGEGAWSLSPRASVSLEIMKGEYPQTNPTSGASNL